LIALGFEFVNGFHDTAHAVATVIYTHSLPANIAVVWLGMFNLIGVLLSSGAVAFGIVSLLPVELILQVGSSAGFAMLFALLSAAMIWNVGTWYFGLPATYAQGACAEITTAAAIGAADGYGLPVSTTHVLPSGIGGTMAANGCGLQMATIRNIVLAWVLTLPAAMMISGFLYWSFSQIL
jgi:PiT family inorganic phosphate transporter